MTDTNKLAELIKQAKSKMWGKTFTCVLERNMFIADHLLANGVILLPEDLRDTEDFSISAFIEAMQMYKQKDRYIKLPCKVGQTVYIIDEPDFAEDFVLDVKVSEIGQDLKGMWIGLELPLGMRLSQYVYPNNLGKSVFLTKEEAEKALKERE